MATFSFLGNKNDDDREKKKEEKVVAQPAKEVPFEPLPSAKSQNLATARRSGSVDLTPPKVFNTPSSVGGAPIDPQAVARRTQLVDDMKRVTGAELPSGQDLADGYRQKRNDMAGQSKPDPIKIPDSGQKGADTTTVQTILAANAGMRGDISALGQNDVGGGADGESFPSLYSGYKAVNNGKDDLEYGYVNKDPEAIKQINDMSRWGSMYGREYLQEMNSGEIAQYNQAYQNGGSKAAQAYLKQITPQLNERYAKRTESFAADQAHKNPLLATAFSILAKPFESLSYVGDVANYVGSKATGKKMDVNSAINNPTIINQATRAQVTKDVEEKYGPVGSFAYGVGVSMADFLLNSGLTGPAGPAAETLSLTLMGSQAAADSVLEAKREGLSDNRAMVLGSVAGAIEYLTEKMGYDALFGNVFKGGGALRYALANIASEGFEEGTSTILNTAAEWLYDTATGQQSSAFKRSVQEYMRQGLSESEATGRAGADWWKQLGLDVAGGAVSGGIMSGGSIAYNAVNDTKTGKTTTPESEGYGSKQEMNEELIRAAKDMPEGSEAYYNGRKAESALKKDGDLSNRMTGSLLRTVADELGEQSNKIAEASEKSIYDATGTNQKLPGAEKRAYDRVEKVFKNARNILAKGGELSNADKFNLRVAQKTMQTALENDWFSDAAKLEQLNNDFRAVNNALGIQVEIAKPAQSEPVQEAPAAQPEPVQAEPVVEEAAPEPEVVQPEPAAPQQTVAESMKTDYDGVGRSRSGVQTMHASLVKEGSALDNAIKTAPRAAQDYDTVTVQSDGTITLVKYDDFNGNLQPESTRIYTGHLVDGEYDWSAEDGSGQILIDKHNLVDPSYAGFDVQASRDAESAWKAKARQYGISYNPSRIESDASYFRSIMDKIAQAEQAEIEAAQEAARAQAEEDNAQPAAEEESAVEEQDQAKPEEPIADERGTSEVDEQNIEQPEMNEADAADDQKRMNEEDAKAFRDLVGKSVRKDSTITLNNGQTLTKVPTAHLAEKFLGYNASGETPTHFSGGKIVISYRNGNTVVADTMNKVYEYNPTIGTKVEIDMIPTKGIVAAYDFGAGEGGGVRFSGNAKLVDVERDGVVYYEVTLPNESDFTLTAQNAEESQETGVKEGNVNDDTRTNDEAGNEAERDTSVSDGGEPAADDVHGSASPEASDGGRTPDSGSVPGDGRSEESVSGTELGHDVDGRQGSADTVRPDDNRGVRDGQGDVSGADAVPTERPSGSTRNNGGRKSGSQRANNRSVENRINDYKNELQNRINAGEITPADAMRLLQEFVKENAMNDLSGRKIGAEKPAAGKKGGSTTKGNQTQQTQSETKPTRPNTTTNIDTRAVQAVNSAIEAMDESQFDALMDLMTRKVAEGRIEAYGRKELSFEDGIKKMAAPYDVRKISDQDRFRMLVDLYFEDRESLQSVAPSIVDVLDGLGYGGDLVSSIFSGDAGSLFTEAKPKQSEPVKNVSVTNKTGATKLNATDVLNPNAEYVAYVPSRVQVDGAKPHPADIVESSAMGAVQTPQPSYTPMLDEKLIKSGKPSIIQMENIVLAGNAHQQTFESGGKTVRKGYFIGDGTGVGKGMQIAAIILDNFNHYDAQTDSTKPEDRRSSKKAVWLSDKITLAEDAKRDWADLGQDESQVFTLGQNFGADKDISREDGILFMPYSRLSTTRGGAKVDGPKNLNKGAKANMPRVDQIARWLGDDFDGVIVFDEAHNMSNAESNKGEAGKRLQERFPNARILYVSATGATEIDNLQYLSRLHLWGEGTAFANFDDFKQKMIRGGVASMELVAQNMKAAGSYLARSISYNGVQYRTLNHTTTEAQREMYDQTAHLWDNVNFALNQVLDMTAFADESKERAIYSSGYWGAHQRFFNQVLTSLSFESVANSIEQDLKDGKSVVLQLTSTNESALNRAVEKASDSDDGYDGLELSPMDILTQFVENRFPIYEYEQRASGPNGKIRWVPVKDKDGNPVINPSAQRIQQDVLGELKAMTGVPEGPLDLIISRFGADAVAEITGRSSRLVNKVDQNGQSHRVLETRDAKVANTTETRAFQNGDKRILVFSDAGGTGRSYHADRRAKNQQQRVQYVLQPGWSAQKAVQGFGRTHRSNQASAPEFVLVTTDISGQKRFVSTIARKLDQLGALTKGQRQTGSGLFSSEDNLETDLARESLTTYYRQNPELVMRLGLSAMNADGTINPSNVDVGQFMNRILGLPVAEQNEVFDGFDRIYTNEIFNAKERGEYDLGIETEKAERVIMNDDRLVMSKPGKGSVRYIDMTSQSRGRMLDFESLPLIDKYGKFSSIVRKNDTGAVVAVFKNGDSYKLVSPAFSNNTHVANISENTLNKSTSVIPEAEWQQAWINEMADDRSLSDKHYRMLVGDVLSVWNTLPTNRPPKVQRVITSDGTQYLGVQIREDEVAATLQKIQVYVQQDGGIKLGTSELMDGMMKDGKAITFLNGLVASRTMIDGKPAVEFTHMHTAELDRIARLYPEIRRTMINKQNRYIIKDVKAAERVINQIKGSQSVVGFDVPDISQKAVLGKFGTIPGKDMTDNEAQWTTTRAADNKAEVRPLSEIMADAQENFGFTLTNGASSVRGAYGWFNPVTNEVHEQRINDIVTVAHEVGHFFNKKYNLLNSSEMTDKIKKELIDGLDPQFAAAYKPSEHASEGVAEFFRRFFTNIDDAKKNYPQFYKFIADNITGKEYDKITVLANQINAALAQGAVDAKATVRNRADGQYDSRSTKRKISDLFQNIHHQMIDSLDAIRRFDVENGSDVYKKAINAQYASQMAYQVLSGDIFYKGQFVATGLKTALHGLDLNSAEEYTDFGEYLKLKHAGERIASNMVVFANPLQNHQDWIDNRLQEIEAEHPNYSKIADEVYKYRHNLIETFGVKAGLIDKATLEEWEKRWKYYVPFYRVMDKGKGTGMVAQSFVNQEAPVKRAKGSSRETWNPLDNLADLTIQWVQAATLNDVGVALVEAAEMAGADASWMTKAVPPKTVATYDARSLKNWERRQVAQHLSTGDIDAKSADVMMDIINDINDVLYQYKVRKPSGNVITVMRKGKASYWQINDPTLLDSMTHVHPNRVKGVWSTIGKMHAFTTQMITGSNIIWSVTKNSLMDAQTMLHNAKDFSNGKSVNLTETAKLVGNIAKGYSEAWKAGRGKDTSPIYQLYLYMGGGSDSAISATYDRSSKAFGADIKKKGALSKLMKSTTGFNNPIEMIEFIGNVVEAGPRYAYFKQCIDIGMTPEEAMYEAHDITVNFARGGEIAKQINLFVPFFNAGVQGADKFVRYMTAEDVKGRGVNRAKVVASRTTSWVASSAIMAAIIYAWNHASPERERDYEHLSNYTKQAYFCLPAFGDGKFLTIPKAREISVLTSVFEGMLSYALADDKHALDGITEYATDAFLPPFAAELAQTVMDPDNHEISDVMGTLGVAGTLYYLGANKDFLGKPIVSESLQQRNKHSQYTRQTSKMAYWISQAFHKSLGVEMSPMKIDFFGEGVLGGYWKMQKALMPVGKENFDWSMGIGKSWKRDSLYSTDLTNWIYNYRDQMQKDSNDGEPGAKSKYALAKSMASFYSTYNLLSKDEELDRDLRSNMLDMIIDYRKSVDDDYYGPAISKIFETCEATGNMEGIPSALTSTITDADGEKHELNASQYVEYQGNYLAYYYDIVESEVTKDMDAISALTVMKYAKDVAKDYAQADALRSIGSKAGSKYEAKYEGIPAATIAQFKALATEARGDRTSLKQAENIQIIYSLDVDDHIKNLLFKSCGYKSDKNNPWRGK